MHVYWAAGGTLGKNASVPSVGGERVFEPSRVATLAIAAALAAAAVVILGAVGWFGDAVPPFAYRWLAFAVALLFILRAIGDFRMVGFFKQPSDSAFAYWDSKLYAPLCAFVAVASLFVAVG